MNTFLYFFIFTVLALINNLVIEGISGTQLWKYPLIVILFFYILIHNNTTYTRPTYIKLCYILAFIKIFHLSSFYSSLYFQENLLTFCRFFIFALSWDFITLYFRQHPEKKIHLATLYYAIFASLLFIPFLFNFFPSPKKGIILAEEVAGGFVGLCGSAHGASIWSAFSLLTLLWFFLYNKTTLTTKIFLCFLICCDFYILYSAYVRTGYLMFIIGSIFLYLQKGKRTWHHLLFLGSFIALITWVLSLNLEDAFTKRLIGVQYDGHIDVGSGRSTFMLLALEAWKDSNLYGWIFGIGQSAVMDKINDELGIRVYAHNGFIDMLTASGLIGITLMSGIALSVWRLLWKNKTSPYFYLASALWGAYYSMQATQGGQALEQDCWLYLASLLVLPTYSPKEKGTASNETL